MNTFRPTRALSAPLLAAIALCAFSAQAQPSAITYPSVARSAPIERAAPAQKRDVTHSPRQRVATESAHSVFVYETLGATPSIRLPMMRHTATAELQAGLPNR